MVDDLLADDVGEALKGHLVVALEDVVQVLAHLLRVALVYRETVQRVQVDPFALVILNRHDAEGVLQAGRA